MMPGRMALLITILLMLINKSGTAHENTPSSDTFSILDLWVLTCIIFVTLALFEYVLVIKIMYKNREATGAVHVGRNWTKVTHYRRGRTSNLTIQFSQQIIDRASGYIFPIMFAITNITFLI